MIPGPGPAQCDITQVTFSASISQRFTQQRWTRHTAIVLFEGGDLRTIDPRSSRSNSAAPGTRGWAIPQEGILTRLIDCRVTYCTLVYRVWILMRSFCIVWRILLSVVHVQTVGGWTCFVVDGPSPMPPNPLVRTPRYSCTPALIPP